MSAMDKIKKMLKGHEDQASTGVDKAGDAADDRTQGKYRGKVDTGQDRLKQQLGDDRGQDGTPPPPHA
ncbi:antitoxin [Streptomyces finlayi]|uniref:Antitoxin n=1 Tax=Streptomyces finlayi TaxID=67296 RepID=A0A7G7BDC1_9ACTN|nr:antitoxin [Streptomyces finlayi]QNE73336.1 antitoxin [Streptomyces finlayi]